MINNKVMIENVEFTYDTEKNYVKDGNVFCKKCNEQINGKKIDIMKNLVISRNKCECDRKFEEMLKKQEKSMKIEYLKGICFKSKVQYQHTFKNFNGEETKSFKIAKNFVKKYDEMKKDNIGLLFYGSVGSGKTYLASAIANALIEEKNINVKIRNFAEIINDLQKSGFNFDKNKYINSIVDTEVLILDDLGIERDTSYAKEQVYNIINNRYLKHKPTIITTNLTYEEIYGNSNSIEYQRIYSRVVEMCVPVMVVGNDYRKIIQREKLNSVKNKRLGGGNN